eukprot:m.234906 g.234906  ORF g.234906 m.234906 type:complete len:356 (+) comp12736_c0_seq1:57-1124(+)
MSGAKNADNYKGLALALSSSAFIGASFIVKKKGLLRARASGNGAGDGGYAYLRESLWWIGLFTMIFGEVANFTAYIYAPAILVTPLGALSVIISAVLASWFLDEQLALLGKVGCALCIVGSTIIVLNAPAEQEVKSVDDITNLMWYNIVFKLYVVFVIAVATVLILNYAPRYGRSNILIYVTICSLVGSLSVIGVKGLGIALKLTFNGTNQMLNGSTWVFVAMVTVCIVIQMNYLNKALDVFNTAHVTPIYYVMFTTFTIIASAILFNGWNDSGLPIGTVSKDNCTATVEVDDFAWSSSLVTCICGFLTICTGVFLLQYSREHPPQLLVQDYEMTAVDKHGEEGYSLVATRVDDP